jgi:hypothetical protein
VKDGVKEFQGMDVQILIWDLYQAPGNEVK